MDTFDRRPPLSLPGVPPLQEQRTRFTTQDSEGLMPTTSVLTATTLTYAIRAGITAGAGTRLVL